MDYYDYYDGQDEDEDDEEDNEEEEEESEEHEEEIPQSEPSDTTTSVNPPLDRPVQVDALLDKWRTKIRKGGVETEETFVQAVHEIFETEHEKETSITKNMVLELENIIESEIASLENTIIFLAKKGRALGNEDPRLKKLSKGITASGKKIRDHAVEIRYKYILS